MKRTITVEFEFEVGDLVRHKADLEDAPHCLIVVELLTQTCHGGTQTFYRCRSVNQALAAGVLTAYTDISSVELAPYPTLEQIVVAQQEKLDCECAQYERRLKRKEEAKARVSGCLNAPDDKPGLEA